MILLESAALAASAVRANTATITKSTRFTSNLQGIGEFLKPLLSCSPGPYFHKGPEDELFLTSKNHSRTLTWPTSALAAIQGPSEPLRSAASADVGQVRFLEWFFD